MVILTVEEREFVLKRLDREHISQLAEGVRYALAQGRPVEACYQPGDGTWYSLLFVPRPEIVGAEGGGTGGHSPQRWWDGDVVVYAQRETVARVGATCDLEYVAAELSANQASALAIAELLKAVVA